MEKSTVEGHRRALRIAYNLDARFSAGREKKCGFVVGGGKGVVLSRV